MSSATERLKDVRKSIDAIDEELVRLFCERQKISDEIAALKEEANLAITDSAREAVVYEAASEAAGEEYRKDALSLMRTVVSLSKLRQTSRLRLSSGVEFPAPAALPDGPVAFQGVEGAYSEEAAIVAAAGRERIAASSFEDVFEMVKSGEAALGALPIENSRTGAIGEVYDLLRRNACYIVGAVWIPIAHCLAGIQGASEAGVREVLSHAEGFRQCRRYLKDSHWALTDVKNTALAARMVAESANPAIAAIASKRAAEAYGLAILRDGIADDSKNRTRFILIASEMAYGRDASAVTVSFSTRHEAGALASVLTPFQLASVNLSRIESRPAQSADTYRFFADLEGSLNDPAVRDAISQAAMMSEYFEILGCYAVLEEPLR